MFLRLFIVRFYRCAKTGLPNSLSSDDSLLKFVNVLGFVKCIVFSANGAVVLESLFNSKCKNTKRVENRYICLLSIVLVNQPALMLQVADYKRI